ncbi:dCTP deaminase domain-containing protein [Bradyrhizobium sp. CCBAU 51745]|uniref:dCTP deaminase domain-containing protein n=1 Tax=Bradyrhizobium sp. CCBAU 51745 TaxID=1325099 RepID=UPI003FA45A5D
MLATNEKGICRTRREAMETQVKQLITRREPGDTFVLHPGQLALTTTPKYVGPPADVHADVLTRSSYTRSGIHLNTMIQPGYRRLLPNRAV